MSLQISTQPLNIHHAQSIPARLENVRNIVGNYYLGKTIGKGQFGKVRTAKHIITKEEVAVKIILKKNVDERRFNLVRREITIMKLLNHPNIIRLYEVLESADAFYFIMEYAGGGQVHDLLQLHGKFSEAQASKYIKQIGSALQYCHENRVVHRDLKTENLLLDSDHNIKIIDFGLSNLFSPDKKMSTYCGSPNYAAPELILKQEYRGPEVDIWSLGVVLYAFVSGKLPFNENDFYTLYTKIINSDYSLPQVSPECASLIQRLLVVEPQKRASLEEVLEHPWIKKNCPEVGSPRLLNDVTKTETEKVNEDLLLHLGLYGFKIEQTRTELLTNEYTSATATYYLLKNKIQRELDCQQRLRQRRQKSPFLFIEDHDEDPSLPPPQPGQAFSRTPPALTVGPRKPTHRRNKTLDIHPHPLISPPSSSPPLLLPDSNSNSPPSSLSFTRTPPNKFLSPLASQQTPHSPISVSPSLFKPSGMYHDLPLYHRPESKLTKQNSTNHEKQAEICKVLPRMEKKPLALSTSELNLEALNSNSRPPPPRRPRTNSLMSLLSSVWSWLGKDDSLSRDRSLSESFISHSSPNMLNSFDN